LIWLILVALVFVVGGAWFVSRSLMVRGIVLAVGLAAVGGYWLLGKPDMRDEPLAGRLEEVRKQAQEAPETITAMQFMALLQQRAQQDPEDPMPHVFMGKILQQAERPTEAMLAYESALRRDPNNLEVLRELPDLRFRMTGQVDPATTALYHQWYELEPSQLRAGYLAGVGDWLAGRKAEAEAVWAEVNAKAPENGPERQMFAALRQMFGIDPAAPAAPSRPPG
jgi:cytochrome c-type biogenesis protein CcmH